MVYGIALGSNLTDRLAALRDGLLLLLAQDATAQLLAQAPLYETDPVDCPAGSPPFVNTVVEVSSELLPLEMLAVLQGIERSLGRPQQRERNDPRPLDMDLLYAGDWVLDVPELTLPHPRMHLRRFVLAPLAEIRPDLVLPGFTETVSELLTALQDDPLSVRRI
jgi:2-amino-4-hydroxy-6-hydroxymethyldihydropteridine diphosphokinase